MIRGRNMEIRKEKLYPGIWRCSVGQENSLTPDRLLGGNIRRDVLAEKQDVEMPDSAAWAKAVLKDSGILLELPVKEERLYGLGLQLKSFLQNGKRKLLRTNADASSDTGDSHAPVPFYVSTAGYGILIDSAVNMEFDMCAARKREETAEKSGCEREERIRDVTEELYAETQRGNCVRVYLKGVQTVVFYCFAGNSITEAVEKYNLFCGGGCLPPVWGLGNLYRCYTGADQKLVEERMDEFAAEDVPVSMIGLEPGWHSHAYSCTFKWSPERFPDPKALAEKAKRYHMRLNAWEQAYVHPEADFYREILPYCGEYEVWGGGVPDFALKEAGEIYGKRQGELIGEGISAVKLDECDGSDYTGGWFFPDFSEFPSGLSGEEEKNLYGALIMRCIKAEYDRRNLRTYSQIRANYSYGASMPFVLYSDLYDHQDFIRGVCNMGFCGLLWSPEVRQCGSGEELIRRVQTVIFSPLSLINAWMIPNPPWKQYDREKNLRNELLEDNRLSEKVKKLLRLRIRLIPYLYSAFYRYYRYGTPPFRALVLDYPEDPKVWECCDSYMMGEDMLISPIPADQREKEVYLPKGKWYNLWTGDELEGGQSFRWTSEKIPVFMKAGSILPLMCNEIIPEGKEVCELEVLLFGDDCRDFFLIEDDGISNDYLKGMQKEVRLSSRQEGAAELEDSEKYRIVSVRKAEKGKEG